MAVTHNNTDARVASTTRRSMLGMIAGVPVAATFGTIAVEAASPSHFDATLSRFWTAFHRYNATETETDGEAYVAAAKEMTALVPSTPAQFVKKFLALWEDGGAPNENIVEDMLRSARHLAAH